MCVTRQTKLCLKFERNVVLSTLNILKKLPILFHYSYYCAIILSTDFNSLRTSHTFENTIKSILHKETLRNLRKMLK